MEYANLFPQLLIVALGLLLGLLLGLKGRDVAFIIAGLLGAAIVITFVITLGVFNVMNNRGALGVGFDILQFFFCGVIGVVIGVVIGLVMRLWKK